MIKHLGHVNICVRDIKQTEKFYCGVLGLKKKFQYIRNGKTTGMYIDAGGGTFIEAHEHPSESAAKPTLGHFCFEVESMDAAIENLRKANVPVTEKKQGKDRSWQAWITDPDGVSIELHEYTSESRQITGEDSIE